jgi:DNA-binding NarL/FixJ family response regulator
MTERLRVMIVDDQAVVRLGFEALLSAQPDMQVVATASNGREGVASAKALHPDVVLMDVRMPVLGGIDATRAITAHPDPPRVLILTTFDLDEYVYDALRAGASGFLLKDATPERIVDAVRVVAAGEALLAPNVTRRLLTEFAARANPQPPERLNAARARSVRAVGARLGQRRDRRNAASRRADRENARQRHPVQARFA